jgi:hypothetical protein
MAKVHCVRWRWVGLIRARRSKAAVLGLSESERPWYAALRLAAHQGAFFEASDRLDLSAASRLLGKDRSSAHRAYREIQAHFQAELRQRQ